MNNDNVHAIPDTVERAPVIATIMAEVATAFTRRRDGLTFEESSAVQIAVHSAIAALARRGMLTDDAMTALGIAAQLKATMSAKEARRRLAVRVPGAEMPHLNGDITGEQFECVVAMAETLAAKAGPAARA